jgi:ribosomal protein S18 acetylase RimI-like enzyme
MVSVVSGDVRIERAGVDRVVAANQPALRLYERAGFRPYHRQLLADV